MVGVILFIQRQVDLYGLKVSLVYIVIYRPDKLHS